MYVRLVQFFFLCRDRDNKGAVHFLDPAHEFFVEREYVFLVCSDDPYVIFVQKGSNGGLCLFSIPYLYDLRSGKTEPRCPVAVSNYNKFIHTPAPHAGFLSGNPQFYSGK